MNVKELRNEIDRIKQQIYMFIQTILVNLMNMQLKMSDFICIVLMNT